MNKSSETLYKISCRIFDADHKLLLNYYPEGYNQVVRVLVRKHILNLETHKQKHLLSGSELKLRQKMGTK